MLEMICKKLGVEIGEEWLAEDGNTYLIEHDGTIEVISPRGSSIGYGFSYWKDIFNGGIKPVWEPEIGETYYMADINGQYLYECREFNNVFFDKYQFRRGLAFRTEEEAIAKSKEILDFVKGDK